AGPPIARFAAGAAGVEVAVADVAGSGRGLIVAGEATGDHPNLSLIDPTTGAIMQTTQPSLSQANGLRVAAGDLDRDGRDEIYAASGFGGESRMDIFDATLCAT